MFGAERVDISGAIVRVHTWKADAVTVKVVLCSGVPAVDRLPPFTVFPSELTPAASDSDKAAAQAAPEARAARLVLETLVVNRTRALVQKWIPATLRRYGRRR